MNDPQREFAIEVVRRLKDAGFTALWAGGCVRDFLLGNEPKDYDVATDAIPDRVREIFGHRRTQAVGASFGVIIVRGPKPAGSVEVATFRTDGSYLDGRRPASVEFSTPEEDAQRRDFTINGMFYDPLEQKVFDYVGGEQDLSAGIIRAIGDPHARMTEDKLRMLRAVRFAATLDFQLDPVTADAIREMAAEILVVSVERIAQELKRMLIDPHRMRAMQLARDVGLLQRIVPELHAILGDDHESPAHDEWNVTLHMLQLLQEPGFELATAALLQAVAPSKGKKSGRHESDADTLEFPDRAVAATAERICNQLRLANDETEEITWLLSHQHALNGVREMPLHRLKRLLVHRYFDDLLALVRAERLARNVDLAPVLFCEEYRRRTPDEEIDPPELLGGQDLIDMGLQPGPEFKALLIAVRDAQLDGEISTRDEAIALVRRLNNNAPDDA